MRLDLRERGFRQAQRRDHLTTAVLSSFREAALAEPTLTAVVDAFESSVLRHIPFACW